MTITHPIILACTDGSNYADSVYDHAAWAAQRLEGTLHVLHMIAPTRDANSLHNFSGSIGLDARHHLKEELVELEEIKGRIARAKANAILEAAQAHLKDKQLPKLIVDAKHGHIAECIEQYEVDAHIVVIGKRGESADMEKLHLGSNVERVIRSCHHPVLVTSRAFKPIHRILIAFDGGPSSLKAIQYVESSPLFEGLHCDLLSVGKPHRDIETSLKKAEQRLVSAGRQVEAHLRSGHPEDVFAQFIVEKGTDMLLMGAYGHSRIRQLMVGSTTTTMVRTCRIPILMFR